MCSTHAFSIFPAIPTHRVRALRHTPYRRVQRSSEKRLRRLFHLPCDRCRKSSRCLHRLPEKFLLLIFQEFFFKRPFKRSCQAACTLIIPQNPIKISHLLTCRLLFIPAAALHHYTPNAAGSGRLKRVYTSKSSLR